jgi:hypothetical protein
MADATGFLLESFENPGQGLLVSLEPLSYRAVPELSDEMGLRSAGYASLVKVGIRRRKTILVAIYAGDERLWLLLGDRSFDLSDSRVTATKSAPWPFVRRFSLLRGEVEVASVTYWMTMLEERYWPTRGDIFSYVVDVARTAVERYRFMRAWMLSQQGKLLSDPNTIAQLESEIEMFRRQARPA